ncbi:MAG: hypothetical protein KDC87_19655 [Planctomycetes bacterium]|nr:hypothetical protein [Planctomycetota bacterium]MCB9871555.1 hypothetical protein [Planctomycetota bacterium]
MFRVVGAAGAEFGRVLHPDGERALTPWIGTDWRAYEPIDVALVGEDGARVLTRSDAPSLGSSLFLFRSRARQVMAESLSRHGVWLPVRCPDADLQLFGVTTLLDALDPERSEVHAYGVDIVAVFEHVLRRDRVGGATVFGVLDDPTSPTFVDQRFVNRWNQAGFVGLEFARVELA